MSTFGQTNLPHLSPMKHHLLLFLLCLPFCLPAQYTVSGYVTDSASGEALIGAVIAVRELKTGTYSNTYGFYSLSLKSTDVTVRIDFPGFVGQQVDLQLTENLRLDVSLAEKDFDLD